MSIHPSASRLLAASQALSAPPHRHRQASLPLLKTASLLRGRAHEACGRARCSFALWIAGAIQGPVVWISTPQEHAHLNPDGIFDFADPARFLWITPSRQDDILWVMEEALRCGGASLVVAELTTPPAITPVRRLHLAAAAAATAAPDGLPPLGLLLTPGDGGAQGIESRWSMQPAHQGRHRCWQLERLRARAQPPRRWHITQPAPRAPLIETAVDGMSQVTAHAAPPNWVVRPPHLRDAPAAPLQP
jgi:protein ImuA